MQDERILLPELAVRVDPGHQPLRRGLFVSGRTVDLSGQEEVLHHLGFEGMFQLRRIEVVIFHGIGRAENLRLLQSFDGVERVELDLQRKRRGETLEIVFVGPATLGLEEKLVGAVVRKDAEFVLDARTIARSATVDHPREERRISETRTQDLVHPLVRMQDIALHLGLPFRLDGGGFGQERETRGVRVAGLERKPGSIDRGDVDPGRRPGLHPVRPDPGFDELLGQTIGSLLADPPSFHHRASDEETAGQEGPGGQNNRLRLENCPCQCTDAANF